MVLLNAPRSFFDFLMKKNAKNLDNPLTHFVSLHSENK